MMDCSSESTILIRFGARQDCSSSENALFEGKGEKANPKIRTDRIRFICRRIRFFVTFYYISYTSKVNDYLATGCGYCLRLKYDTKMENCSQGNFYARYLYRPSGASIPMNNNSSHRLRSGLRWVHSQIFVKCCFVAQTFRFDVCCA